MIEQRQRCVHSACALHAERNMGIRRIGASTLNRSLAQRAVLGFGFQTEGIRWMTQADFY